MSDMAWIFTSILLTVFYGLLSNRCSKKCFRNIKDNCLMSLLVSLAAGAFLCLLSPWTSVSAQTAFMAVFFGMLTAGTWIFKLLAFSVGSMAHTMLLGSFSMLIPTVYGMVRGEGMNVHQGVGLLLLLASVVMILKPKGTGINKKWALAGGATFLCSGLIGIMQKLHQGSAYKDETSQFLVIAFAVSALVAGVLWLCLGKKSLPGEETREESLFRGMRLLLSALLCGLCAGACNRINLLLSGSVPSVILFPVLNGGVLLLSFGASKLLLGERAELSQNIGFVLGVAAIALIA